ncbi:hypothetical protein TL16_g04624 [Triparma laevis f. inornata]|uniref:Uncharacterized protein n=1 Tax=Triparma laevis f. inornata TaxID=1714386 RepID=A0A9W7AD55_9STRA|nr:hypothetical protein TL16_g04624 [Triparma laevis f. inornata]
MAKSVLPSLFSYILLALLIFLAIRQSSQQFKKIRDKLLETDNITSEETIKDIEMQGPYFAAFRLQYTPQMYNHEETQVLRKISGACIMTSLPSILYAIMEILIWSSKKSTDDDDTEVEVEGDENDGIDCKDGGDEENQVREVATSPIQQQHADNGDEDDDDNDDGVIEMKDIKKEETKRKPSIIKTP